jgi:hypothetical protein
VVWSRLAGAAQFGAFSALRSPFGEKGKERNAAPARAISGQAKRWLG